MAGKIDAFLKISVAISVLAASSGVGYYFGYYLPRRDARIEEEQRAEKKRSETDQRAAQDRAIAVQRESEARQAYARAQAQARYDQCNLMARRNYSANWAGSCKSELERARASYTTCLRFSTKETCDATWTKELTQSATECSLPADTAQRWENARNQALQLCLEEHRAGLQ